jgi:hypothetical protein
MRPFIDISNLDYNGDTLIYYSRMYVILSIIVLFSLFIGSIYTLSFKDGYICSILLWVIILVYGQKTYYRLQEINEVQFKINSKGIQFRNEDFITWDNIENAKVISEKSGYDDFIYYFRYYISSENRLIITEIEPLNISHNELELAIRIFTEKFNFEKNKIQLE